MRGADRGHLSGSTNSIVAGLERLREKRPSLVLTAARSGKATETIRQILAAARERFVEAGHAGLTMRAVSEAAGISPGNLNYYFPSKRALLEAMLREELADYIDAHLALIGNGDGDPLELLLDVVGFYISNGRESHRFFFQMWGFAASDETARAIVRDLYRPIGGFILSLVLAANPALGEARARQVVLQIFSLEEGLKLFIGMGPDTAPALRTAERDIRALTRKLVLEG